MQLQPTGREEQTVWPQDCRKKLYTFPKEAGEAACLVAVKNNERREEVVR